MPAPATVVVGAGTLSARLGVIASRIGREIFVISREIQNFTQCLKKRWKGEVGFMRNIATEMTQHHFSLGVTDDHSNFRFSTDKNSDGTAGISWLAIQVHSGMQFWLFAGRDNVSPQVECFDAVATLSGEILQEHPTRMRATNVNTESPSVELVASTPRS